MTIARVDVWVATVVSFLVKMESRMGRREKEYADKAGKFYGNCDKEMDWEC